MNNIEQSKSILNSKLTEQLEEILNRSKEGWSRERRLLVAISFIEAIHLFLKEQYLKNNDTDLSDLERFLSDNQLWNFYHSTRTK